MWLNDWQLSKLSRCGSQGLLHVPKLVLRPLRLSRWQTIQVSRTRNAYEKLGTRNLYVCHHYSYEKLGWRLWVKCVMRKVKCGMKNAERRWLVNTEDHGRCGNINRLRCPAIWLPLNSHSGIHFHLKFKYSWAFQHRQSFRMTDPININQNRP